MYKYIIICVSLSLCCVLCDLGKEEGADCEWEGVKGRCVKKSRCLTTLDKKSPKQPVCSQQGEVTVVCCTDCQLINDTSNVVISPTSGIFFKDGRKARDNCLSYLQAELPYQCRVDGFYGGVTRRLDEEKKCHKYNLWAIGGAPPPGRKPNAEYPHQAMLGYGNDVETAQWLAGGSIISDRYILTAAQTNRFNFNPERIAELKFVAVGVSNSSQPASFQTYKVKRFIAHPEYKSPSKYHDIGLIETESPIQFNKNVLPACLLVEEVPIEDAVTTTWRDLSSDARSKFAVTLQTIPVEKFSDEECKDVYKPHRHLREGVDLTKQMCYGSRTNPSESCKGLSGEPLLIKKQFSSCVYTVIGVTSFGFHRCGPDTLKPDVYTRVSYYVPWIESIVWP